MEQKRRKSWLKGLFASLLCVPFLLGALAGCGEKNDDPPKGDSGDPPGSGSEIETPEKEGDVTFTAMTETANLDAYAKNALEKEIDYLLSIDAERLLYNFYDNAGLKPVNNKPRYDGWENSLIAGHTMGHYLTAIAQAYSNGGTSSDPKKALERRIKDIVLTLKDCQDEAENSKMGAHHGFIWGANVINRANVEVQFDNVEQGKANIGSEAWVPWYTMHKILAGLIDVYTLAGNETALEVAKGLGDWVYERVSKWTEATRKTVLSIEYGGMNDALYNLYAVTGEEKYAVAAHQFDEDIPTQGTFTNKSMIDRILDEEENYLRGQHANTTIPKIIGLLNGYIRTNGKSIDGVTANANGRLLPKVYLQVAEKFWTRVVEHHSYVTGGNSNDEHFQADDSQWPSRSNINCETCNTYNMLKLSRMLFSLTKEKKYLDYYENTYINAILSSQNPETGMTMYFQPMAPGYFKVYSSEFEHFWCCTGSGMESMSKLNDSIYYKAGGATYVAMYMNSTYKTDGLSLKMTADLENSDDVTIEVEEGVTTLKLRRPDWTTKFEVKKNGESVNVAATDDFASVDAKKGDTVTLKLGKDVTVHTLPNASGVYAFKYGPFVLSEQLGTENMGTTGHGVQVEKAASAVGTVKYQTTKNDLKDFRENINTYMTRNNDGTFTLTGVNGGPLTYVLHYKQYTHRYAIYLTFEGEDAGSDVPETPSVEETEIEAVIQPGRGQYEGGGFLEDNGSTGSDAVGRYANANGSFSYWVGVDTSDAGRNFIKTALAKADNGKSLKMSVNGTTFYETTLNYTGSDDIYDVYIPIPSALVSGAAEVSKGDPASTMTRIKVTVESAKAGEASAALHTYFKTVKLSAGATAYFVDCGDYDPKTLSAGDSFGLFNSVTEQVYGADPAFKGINWGIWDDAATATAPAPEAGKGIGTKTTWAFEATSDGADKTVSNRYTKNQYENGWQTFKIAYKFDLPDGKYTVKAYFTDPWSCSQNPAVSANGTQMKTGCAMDTEISFDVTVSGGQLLLEFTSQNNNGTQKCVNLCYIKILYA